MDFANSIIRQRLWKNYKLELKQNTQNNNHDSNVVANMFSRVAEIHLPTKIDYETMAKEHEVDNSLKSLMENGSRLKPKPIELACGSKLMCDVSTGTRRPYVPETFRKFVFNSVHCLSHPVPTRYRMR
ncbi:hypothetical protein HNY73_010021 [Argiope bruennichi]|uniref:Uncharacterized protein n=1 Tax=Argiope bruennichi TaxID=94029 RepID=A0A8T0EZU1_ARGBR|nr:hypothetical protein HNY73_010021 [Argiope bruennichi]